MKGAYSLAFGAEDITTAQMEKAIDEWFRLYYYRERNEQENPCKQVAHVIVRKLVRAVFSEYGWQCDDSFGQRIMTALDQVRERAVQLALVGGECYLKPMPGKDGFSFVAVPRNQVLVFGRNGAGEITDVGSAIVSVRDKWYYTLLERRTVDGHGYLTIRNRLFRSRDKTSLGQEVALHQLTEYENLAAEYTYGQPIGSVGLVSVRTPVLNCVDGSADAVSVYAGAVGLIRGVDENMAQLDGEFQRGKSRIIVSADMLRRDEWGRFSFDDTTFVGLDADPEAVGVTIFAPELREGSYLAREQDLLRGVENVIGLKRGLLSEVEAADRTATEITSTEGEYALTVVDFQRMWERSVREVLRVCDVLGRLYRVAGAGAAQVAIDWGNGVLHDEQAAAFR